MGKKNMSRHNDNDSLLVRPHPTGTGRQRSVDGASRSNPITERTRAAARTCPWLPSQESVATQSEPTGGQHCLTRRSLRRQPFSQTDADPGVKVAVLWDFFRCDWKCWASCPSLFLDLGKSHFLFRN